jgi:hypothetical protein
MRGLSRVDLAVLPSPVSSHRPEVGDFCDRKHIQHPAFKPFEKNVLQDSRDPDKKREGQERESNDRSVKNNS